MKKQPYHKNSKKVCIKCPECYKEICGISQAQAEASLKEHRRSNIHKERLQAISSNYAVIKMEGLRKGKTTLAFINLEKEVQAIKNKKGGITS